MLTVHEKYVASLREKARKAGKPLGPQAQAATRRPADYAELSPQTQWDIDKGLGILDWDGEWNS